MSTIKDRYRIWVPHPWFVMVRVFVSMRNPLKRYYGRGDLHFITFSCYRRRPLLGRARSRERFLKTLDRVRSQWGFRLLGFVVMPEHVHLLVSEPCKGDLSKAMQMLKQGTSRTLRKAKRTRREQLPLPFADEVTQEPHFWQRRFYDFNVWSKAKCKEKLLYMHANPVRRRLVSHPRDWPWSSWSHYAKSGKGLISIDRIDLSLRSENPHPLQTKGAAPKNFDHQERSEELRASPSPRKQPID